MAARASSAVPVPMQARMREPRREPKREPGRGFAAPHHADAPVHARGL